MRNDTDKQSGRARPTQSGAWDRLNGIKGDVFAGYNALENHQYQEACDIWWGAWQRLREVAEQQQVRTLWALDNLCLKEPLVVNWVHDFEMELWNASTSRGHVGYPWFLARRIELCRDILERFPDEDRDTALSFRGPLAESHFHLGDRETCDRLFEQWLAEEPTWVWGWIHWADCYSFFLGNAREDLIRGREILGRGLAVPGVSDTADMLNRLAAVYQQLGDDDRAEAALAEANEAATPAEEPVWPTRKIGRNEPCPCGSDRKYKKCCGR